MKKNYYSSGAVKFYKDAFATLDAGKYGQVRNNFSDSEDAFNYIGYQIGSWTIGECYKKANKDNIDKVVGQIFSELWKFTLRKRDEQGQYLDKYSNPINVRAYLFNVIPKRIKNIYKLSEKEKEFSKYLSLDYKNDEDDKLSFYETIQDKKNPYAEVDISDLVTRIIDIFEIIEKSRKMSELDCCILNDMKKMTMNGEIVLSFRNYKNDEIVEQFKGRLINGKEVDSTMVADRRRKIQSWFRKEMPDFEKNFYN